MGYFKISVFILFCAIFVSPCFVHSQQKDRNPMSFEKEYFYIDPVVFYNPKENSKGRLDLYVEIPLENLQFKKNSTSEIYSAKIDYTVKIKNMQDIVVLNETFSEVISNSKSEQKRITELSFYAVKKFFLNPDLYKVSFILKDNNNKVEYSKEASFKVRNFAGEKLAVSDILILSDYKADTEGKKEITPLVNNNVGSLKDFFAFFEIYSGYDTTVEKQYRYRLTDNRERLVSEGLWKYMLNPGNNGKVEKISTKDFVMGIYKLEISDSASNEVIAGKYFIYRWENFPVNIKDLDIAVSQIIYIATSTEMEHIKSAKTAVEKERRFLEFWRSKNPNPNSPKNTILIEYYRRVKVANERFSHYVEGWKTDMGMVYIKFGEPTNIERHPFDYDSKPYEIWDYYDINRRYIFIDYSGFGDYRLTTPLMDEYPRYRF